MTCAEAFGAPRQTRKHEEENTSEARPLRERLFDLTHLNTLINLDSKHGNGLLVWFDLQLHNQRPREGGAENAQSRRTGCSERLSQRPSFPSARAAMSLKVSAAPVAEAHIGPR